MAIERNYFITMHRQAGVHSKFHWTEIPGHFANRDGTPGQTIKPGQSRPNWDVWYVYIKPWCSLSSRH